MTTTTVDTPHGPAAVHLHPVPDARGALVLGHGAGGGVGAPDLTAALRAAQAAACSVALVEQPYRAAGRRVPPRAPTLDAAWTVVMQRLSREELAGLPVVVGGRSSGARVACRTAEATGALGVLCLAFPLQPPARAGKDRGPSRLLELDGVGVPVLVVQGDRDPFGLPPEAERRTVATVRSDHSLGTDLPAVGAAVTAWLRDVMPPA